MVEDLLAQALLVLGIAVRPAALAVVAAGPVLVVLHGLGSLLLCAVLVGISLFLALVPPQRDRGGAADLCPSCVAPAVLLLRVGGIKTVTGALVAGTVTAVLPVLQQQVPSLGGLAYLVTGIAALSVGSAPGGLGGALSDLGHRLARRRRVVTPAAPARPVSRELAGVR